MVSYTRKQKVENWAEHDEAEQFGADEHVEVETLQEAWERASADHRAAQASPPPDRPFVPVSIDDHEGNAYDAEAIDRTLNPRSRFAGHWG